MSISPELLTLSFKQISKFHVESHLLNLFFLFQVLQIKIKTGAFPFLNIVFLLYAYACASKRVTALQHFSCLIFLKINLNFVREPENYFKKICVPIYCFLCASDRMFVTLAFGSCI